MDESVVGDTSAEDSMGVDGGLEDDTSLSFKDIVNHVHSKGARGAVSDLGAPVKPNLWTLMSRTERLLRK